MDNLAKKLLGRQPPRPAPENNLRDVRESEGLSQSELARLARVSVTTISEAENRTRAIGKRSRKKIINGLNANPNKVDRNTRYQHSDVFPNDP
jgi:transcriptional regulator with XRE-family HTH domain